MNGNNYNMVCTRGLAYAFATYKTRGKVRIDPSRDQVEEVKEIIVEEKTNKSAI